MQRSEKSADRRFCSWLFIVFGPLFVLGGFAFAFTTMGALFVWTGLSLLLAGIALRTPLPSMLIALLALTMGVGLAAYTVLIYPGDGL